MKKLITVFLIIAMSTSVVGCGKNATINTIPKEEPPVLEIAYSVRPELKQFLDDYETFINEYCDFLESYSAADESQQLGLSNDYVEIMGVYADMVEDIQSLNTDTLNAAELAYYTEVLGRCSVRMLEVNTTVG